MDTPKAPAILVVDDEPELADLLGDLLGDLGFKATVTHSVARAREALQTGSFTAIISDMNMPQFSGLDLLRDIHALPEPKPMFFLLTGDPSQEVQTEFYALGGKKLFGKPFDPEVLLEFLK